jgi:hypothetical protein
MMVSKFSTLTSTKGCGRFMPALLKKTSYAAVRCTASSNAARLVTSTAMASADPPRSRICLAPASISSMERAMSVT